MSLIIAAAQSSSVPGDIARNVAHHLRFGLVAAERGVQLLVFPELSLTGYELSLARANVVQLESPALDALRRLAKGAGMTIVVGGPMRGEGNVLHIAAFALRPDGSAATYTKEYVHQSEESVFTSGPGGPTLTVEDATVALAVCADASHAQHAARAATRGASLYAASVMITDDAYARKTGLLKGYAREHHIAVLMANYSGATGGEASAGKSAVWSENGELVAASAGREEELVIGVKRGEEWQGAVLPVS